MVVLLQQLSAGTFNHGRAPGALAELQRAFHAAQGPAEAAWRASG